jgi:cyclomaltodextrinase
VFSYGTMTWHYDDDKKAFSLTRQYKEKTLRAIFNEGEAFEVEKAGTRLFGQNYHEDDAYQLTRHGFVIEKL